MTTLWGYYRYKKSLGLRHTSDIADNFMAIDFYKDFTIVGDNIFAETVISMKTTTSKNLDNWLASNPIKTNLNNLIEGLGVDNGILWNGTTIKYTKVEVHIYMPKANIAPELESDWFGKLAAERPNIKFEIKALEDYIE